MNEERKLDRRRKIERKRAIAKRKREISLANVSPSSVTFDSLSHIILSIDRLKPQVSKT